MKKDQRSQRQAVMYLRVASPDPQDHRAIQCQRARCLQLAKHHGPTAIREYLEVGRSARLDQQTELQRLLDDLDQQRDVAFVIVWDDARLGRSLEQLEQVRHHIRSCGAEVITTTGIETAEQSMRRYGLRGDRTIETGGLT